MIKRTIFCLYLLLIATLTFAQAEQAIDKLTIAKVLRYYNNSQADSLYKNFDPIMKSAFPLDKVSALFGQMHTQLGSLKQTTFIQYSTGASVYKADYEKDGLMIVLSVNTLKQISGLYFKPYQAAAAADVKPKAADASTAVREISDPLLTETPFVLKGLGGTLSGTLTTPKNITGKIPVVIIIAGTAPTDRNGNSPGIKGDTYKYIADGLGRAGIACLRYDKRGVGQSTSSAKETDRKFTDLVNDASGLLIQLKEDSRFSKFIILGHGEGSLIGMITAFSEPVNAFISAEGPAETADKILMEQVTKTKPPAVADEFKTIVDSLRKGKTVPRVDPALYAIARPAVQPFLMTWMVFDPIRVIKKVKIPMLIIQGTTDMQVMVTEGEKLKKARSEATLKIIDGMNYILKPAPADKDKNEATYNDPSIAVKQEFMTTVVDFIKALK